MPIIALVITFVAFIVGGLIALLAGEGGEPILVIGIVGLLLTLVVGIVVEVGGGSRGIDRMDRNLKAYDQARATEAASNAKRA